MVVAPLNMHQSDRAAFAAALNSEPPAPIPAHTGSDDTVRLLAALVVAGRKGRADVVRRYSNIVRPCLRFTHAESLLDAIVHACEGGADGFDERMIHAVADAPDVARLYGNVAPHVVTDVMLPAWAERVIEGYKEDERKRIDDDVRARLAAGLPVDHAATARRIAELDALGTAPDAPRAKSLAAVMAEVYPADADAVSGLLPAGGVLLLAGEPKSGKSWLAYRLALDYAAPEPQPWFGHFATHGGRVVILTDTSECIEREFQKRMRMLRATGHERVYLLMPAMLGLPRLSLACPSDFAALRDALAAHGLGAGDVLILDSMTRFIGGDENSSAWVDEFFRTLRALTPASKILIHHLRKAGQFDDSANAFSRLRGSSDIYAAVDAVLLVKRDGDDHELRLSSRYNAELEPFHVRREMDAGGCLSFVYSDSPAVLTGETILDILADAGNPMPRQTLLEKAGERGISRAACDEAVGLLLRVKKIAKDRRGREAVYYVL